MRQPYVPHLYVSILFSNEYMYDNIVREYIPLDVAGNSRKSCVARIALRARTGRHSTLSLSLSLSLSLFLSFSSSCSGPREKPVHSNLIAAKSKPRGSDHVDEDERRSSRYGRTSTKNMRHVTVRWTDLVFLHTWHGHRRIRCQSPRTVRTRVSRARATGTHRLLSRRSGEFKTRWPAAVGASQACDRVVTRARTNKQLSQSCRRYRDIERFTLTNVTRLGTRDLSRAADQR